MLSTPIGARSGCFTPSFGGITHHAPHQRSNATDGDNGDVPGAGRSHGPMAEVMAAAFRGYGPVWGADIALHAG